MKSKPATNNVIAIKSPRACGAWIEKILCVSIGTLNVGRPALAGRGLKYFRLGGFYLVFKRRPALAGRGLK